VTARLLDMKAFRNGETSVGDGVKLIVADKTSAALKNVLLAKLRAALNTVDMSTRLLDK
jgi:hypothetical protein